MNLNHWFILNYSCFTKNYARLISRRQWELYGIIYAWCRKVSFDLQTLTKYILVHAWEPLAVCPTLWGLRIARYCRTDNVRAHADMIYICRHMEYWMPMATEKRSIGTILHWPWYNHTRRHLPLLGSLTVSKVCEVSESQEQSVK